MFEVVRKIQYGRFLIIYNVDFRSYIVHITIESISPYGDNLNKHLGTLM